VARKRLPECAFLIPIRRDRNLSDGQLHRRTCWKWLEDNLDQFGGATRDTALHQGWYPDPDTGKKVVDDSRRYVVALPQDQVDELRAVLREACTVFQQKCIYLSVAGYVEFVYGPGHETE
jgi:hypothetical protein